MNEQLKFRGIQKIVLLYKELHSEGMRCKKASSAVIWSLKTIEATKDFVVTRRDHNP